MKKKLWLILSLIIILTTFVKADIPPDPGQTRLSLDLNVETKEDFPEYRFFINFFGLIREVEIKKGKNSIQANGGGARFSNGTLWAIPKKSLKNETNEQISQALNEKKISGAIELTQHQFTRTVPDSDFDTVQNPPYLLEPDGEKGLKITRQAEIPNKNRGGSGTYFSKFVSSKGLTLLGFIVLIGFPTAAIIILGIWLFRRKGRELG